MRLNRLVIALLTGLAPALSGAQLPLQPVPTRAADGRLVLEAYLSRHRLTAAEGARPAELTGEGARLLWALGTPGEPGRGSRLAAGAAAGVFFSHTPKRGGVESWHYGVEGDLAPFAGPSPLVEPIVSLGVGALRSRADQGALEPIRFSGDTFIPLLSPGVRGARLVGAAARTSTHLALTPGVGARLRIGPGMAVRADARDALVPRGGVRHNLELAGGLSVRM